MSMEAALDEERLAVLELMEGLNKKKDDHRGSGSSASGMNAGASASNPSLAHRPAVRSMLDVGDVPPPRHKSIAGTSEAGISHQAPVRSMLDIGPAPKSKTPSTRSANTSPTLPAAQLAHGNRSLSEAASHLPTFGPRSGRQNGDVTDDYQFSGYLQSNPGGPVMPKRNTLAGKQPTKQPHSMADAVRGELGPNPLKERQLRKSRSPHNRLSVRTSPAASSNMLVMDDGSVIDKDTAYRRLSDANLIKSGAFSKFAEKRTNDSDGNGRMTKNSYDDGENVVESSDESASSDEEGPRGRRKSKRSSPPPDTPLGLGKGDKSPRAPKSLLAAAEEERAMLANKDSRPYRVKSLLEPEVTVTGPTGDRVKSIRQGVHPSNAFDLGGASGFTTPHTSDTEQDISDIRRAQKLAILLTPITSAPEAQRTVRTMFRGDYAKMQKEAEEDIRRLRKYLVATDLSEEAAHALEWTVGTVLRDGDTLLAVYCIDEETGITESAEGTPTTEKQAASIAGSTNSLPSTFPGIRKASAVLVPSPLNPGTPRGSNTPRSGSVAPLTRNTSSREQERYRAVEDITERISKLLRKTKLQIRVVIEVIHCKSPKHLICEVIDYFNPTMVILGSRGRSALKGYVRLTSSLPNYIVSSSPSYYFEAFTPQPPSFQRILYYLTYPFSWLWIAEDLKLTCASVILGSFSNYLVTKSSVPVMVARKRLRKHTKYKRPSGRMANNLPKLDHRTLATAKID